MIPSATRFRNDFRHVVRSQIKSRIRETRGYHGNGNFASRNLPRFVTPPIRSSLRAGWHEHAWKRLTRRKRYHGQSRDFSFFLNPLDILQRSNRPYQLYIILLSHIQLWKYRLERIILYTSKLIRLRHASELCQRNNVVLLSFLYESNL